MKTFLIIITIWFFVAVFNIAKHCKKENEDFNPFASTFANYIGFMLGMIVVIPTIIYLTIKFLP